MKAIHLTIAFLLEIIMIIALAVAGYHLSSMRWLHYTLAIALPLMVIILWAKWAAPKSATRLPYPSLHFFKLFLFTVTTILLFITGYRISAIIFLAAVLVNELVGYRFERKERAKELVHKSLPSSLSSFLSKK